MNIDDKVSDAHDGDSVTPDVMDELEMLEDVAASADKGNKSFFGKKNKSGKGRKAKKNKKSAVMAEEDTPSQSASDGLAQSETADFGQSAPESEMSETEALSAVMFGGDTGSNEEVSLTDRVSEEMQPEVADTDTTETEKVEPKAKGWRRASKDKNAKEKTPKEKKPKEKRLRGRKKKGQHSEEQEEDALLESLLAVVDGQSGDSSSDGSISDAGTSDSLTEEEFLDAGPTDGESWQATEAEQGEEAFEEDIFAQPDHYLQHVEIPQDEEYFEETEFSAGESYSGETQFFGSESFSDETGFSGDEDFSGEAGFSGDEDFSGEAGFSGNEDFSYGTDHSKDSVYLNGSETESNADGQSVDEFTGEEAQTLTDTEESDSATAEEEAGKTKKAAKAALKAQKKSKKPKKKRKQIFIGISVKLIGAFLLPVALFVVVGINNYSKSEQGLRSQAETLTFTSVNMLNEYFDLGYENIELTALRISTNMNVSSHFGGKYDSNYEVAAKTSIVNEAVAEKYIQAVVAFSKNQKNSISNTGVVKKKDLYGAFVESPAGQFVEEQFEGKKGNERSCWLTSHPEIDELMDYNAEDYAMSYVKEIVDSSNKPVGYMLIDVKTSFIKDILDNAKIGKNSIRGFVTNDGTEIISGTDSDFHFSDMKFFQNINDESGYKYVTYKGESYLFLYARSSRGAGMVCAMVPKSVIIEKANEMKSSTIISIVICCIIAIAGGYILATGIAKALKKVNKVMKQMAEGDLTKTIHIRRNDEFSILSGNIGNTIHSIKQLILKLTHVSEQVHESAEKVNDNSEVLYKATEDITQSISDIEKGLIQQSADTESCLMQMSDLANKIGVVSDRTNEIEKIAGNTQDAVNSGVVIVAELGDKVKDTTMITKDIINNITELERESKAINSIIRTINEIADETNLLALNASIEAARAGEVGRGFVVVADEVRKLAEQSGKAAQQVAKIIKRIQKRVAVTMRTAENAEVIISNQEDSLGTTIQVFEDIRGHILELAGDLDTISSNIHGIEEAKNSTLEAVASISATSNETEAASAELTKAAERQMRAVEVLYDEVKILQRDSTDLEESVSVFKVVDEEETVALEESAETYGESAEEQVEQEDGEAVAAEGFAETENIPMDSNN